MKPVPINGMTLNKELRDKQMTGEGQTAIVEQQPTKEPNNHAK